MLLHMCGGELFIHSNECAIHSLFIVNSAVLLTVGNGEADGDEGLIVA